MVTLLPSQKPRQTDFRFAELHGAKIDTWIITRTTLYTSTPVTINPSYNQLKPSFGFILDKKPFKSLGVYISIQALTAQLKTMVALVRT
jgi:hypothetical protein